MLFNRISQHINLEVCVRNPLNSHGWTFKQNIYIFVCLLDISGKTSPCDALKKIKTKTFNLYIKLPWNDLKWNNETRVKG